MGHGVNGCSPLPTDTHSGRVDSDRAAPGDVLFSSRQVRWNQETKSRKEGIALESGIRWYSCRRHPAGAERRGSKVYGWIKRHGRVRHRKRPKIRAGDGLISKRDRHRRIRGQILRLEHASKPDVVAGVDRKIVEIVRARGRKLTTPCWRRRRCRRSRRHVAVNERGTLVYAADSGAEGALNIVSPIEGYERGVCEVCA